MRAAPHLRPRAAGGFRQREYGVAGAVVVHVESAVAGEVAQEGERRRFAAAVALAADADTVRREFADFRKKHLGDRTQFQ